MEQVATEPQSKTLIQETSNNWPLVLMRSYWQGLDDFRASCDYPKTAASELRSTRTCIAFLVFPISVALHTPVRASVLVFHIKKAKTSSYGYIHTCIRPHRPPSRSSQLQSFHVPFPPILVSSRNVLTQMSTSLFECVRSSYRASSASSLTKILGKFAKGGGGGILLCQMIYATQKQGATKTFTVQTFKQE